MQATTKKQKSEALSFLTLRISNCTQQPIYRYILNKWDNNVSACVRNKSWCVCAHMIALARIFNDQTVESVMCIVKCLCVTICVQIAFAINIAHDLFNLKWNEHLNIDTHSLFCWLDAVPLVRLTFRMSVKKNKGKILLNHMNEDRASEWEWISTLLDTRVRSI